MARKKSAVPPAIRFRDNQRRSRARHKEYVEDMKQKLVELENRGVQASQEVQQAARLVDRENQLLRQLLAQKGVSFSEISEFLHLNWLEVGKENTIRSLTADRVNFPSQVQLGGAVPSHLTGSTGDHCFREQCNDVDNQKQCTVSPVRPINTSSQKSLPLSCSKTSLGPSSSYRSITPTTTTCSSFDMNQTQCSKPPPGPLNSELDNLGLEKSCEEAAAIIATMRGHGDKMRARYELGCGETTVCRIKNVNLLEFLDSDEPSSSQHPP